MTLQNDNDDTTATSARPLSSEVVEGQGGGGGGGKPLPLEASHEELFQCQFSSWFRTFRYLPSPSEEDDRGDDKRTNVTIKSKIISSPLPKEFIDFLLADGIRLPEGATKLSSCAPNEEVVSPRRQDDDDDDNDFGDEQEENKQQQEEASPSSSSISHQYSFPVLNQQITEAIEELGGSVIPKLNWSAPKDATWVNEGTLKCKTPGDVYLLLKSSDFCLHDLQQLQQQKKNDDNTTTTTTTTNNGTTTTPSSDTTSDTTTTTTHPRSSSSLELVLRKWCNFYPSMEFRCFVRNHILVGISQRNHSQHYPHLLLDRGRIRSFVMEFFDNVVCHRFANNQLGNYVFDVYVDRSDRVWLIDYNVWCIQTDSLMYTWEELVAMEVPLLAVGEESSLDGDDHPWPELRIVETALEVRHDPLSSYRAPMDTVALASSSSPHNNNRQQQQATGAGVTSFESFMAMCQKPSERNDSSSDDDE